MGYLVLGFGSKKRIRKTPRFGKRFPKRLAVECFHLRYLFFGFRASLALGRADVKPRTVVKSSQPSQTLSVCRQPVYQKLGEVGENGTVRAFGRRNKTLCDRYVDVCLVRVPVGYYGCDRFWSSPTCLRDFKDQTNSLDYLDLRMLELAGMPLAVPSTWTIPTFVWRSFEPKVRRDR